MPIYCYKTPGGTITDRVFPVGKAPAHITHADPAEGMFVLNAALLQKESSLHLLEDGR